MKAITMIEHKSNEIYEPMDADPFTDLRNLFLRTKISAPGVAFSALAVDGRHDASVLQWIGEPSPTALTIDMEETRSMNCVRLWPSWDDKRLYRYFIEASLDGETWTLLVDRRQNDQLATPRGETYLFPEIAARYARITFTHASGGGRMSGHLAEIEAHLLPPPIAEAFEARRKSWENVPDGFNGAFGSTNVHYARDVAPCKLLQGKTWRATAWRGERVNAQALLWTRETVEQVRLSATALQNDEGRTLEAGCVDVRFVRYVLGDDRIVPDVIDTISRLDLPERSTRPVWISVNVPRDAMPGVYRGHVVAQAAAGLSETFDIEIEVLSLELPEPCDWEIHLDIWQNPFAVARYHRVEPWSPEHFRLLEPVLRMYADAGGKCLTTTILYQPWGNQTYDVWETMIEWIHLPDGSWKYDYSVFDRYVEFGIACGAGRYINCISMVPWTDRYRYLDAATGDYEDIVTKPGEAAYNALWRSFLADFVPHLREKGYLGRVGIATDERPLPLMKPMIDLIREVAPELRISVAGGSESELSELVEDQCTIIYEPVDAAICRKRAEAGRTTTFYVCCVPGKPNTFTCSPPAESAWMGLHAAAHGYSGFCRWALNSWVEDPLHDTNHVIWPGGDCFLVYPGPRSSIRFERLREGIQDYEKIRILRAKAAKRGETARDSMGRLDTALASVTWDSVEKTPAEELVGVVREALEMASRRLEA